MAVPKKRMPFAKYQISHNLWINRKDNTLKIFEKRNTMTNNVTTFASMDLYPEVARAIEALGFENATEIQAQSIPLILEGKDVIGRSNTGTGKTIAFGIPAIQAIMDSDKKNTVQVLILCPTRELAMQACKEINKLSEYVPGIKPVDIYGGAPMDRQIAKLKAGANIVIGTPGRVMDHMRRRTLKLEELKMIILDEADEMLSMGFREDIETILQTTPDDRQTILFSATIPSSIMSLTKQYQKNPQLVEIKSKQVTVDRIAQFYVDVPMGRKMDSLNVLLKYHSPNLSMIFCNTKKMVEEIMDFLNQNGFKAEGLHGDMKQAQRTRVLDSFKYGKTEILVATDVAARGIDVEDLDYVFNYDVPQNVEYYVHRIGRTGRAGKDGTAITICSGRKQALQLSDIGRIVKAQIKLEKLPTPADILLKTSAKNMQLIEDKVAELAEKPSAFAPMIAALVEKGIAIEAIAAAAVEMNFSADLNVPVINSFTPRMGDENHRKIVINVGRANQIAPNHIVGAITERTNLKGRDIGKIEIYDNKTIVSIPQDKIDQTLAAMQDCKICGKSTITTIYLHKEGDNSYGSRGGNSRGGYRGNSDRGGYRGNNGGDRGGYRGSNDRGGYRSSAAPRPFVPKTRPE